MPSSPSLKEEIRRRTRNALKLAVPDAEIPRLRGYDHMASWLLFQRAGTMEWWDPPVGEIRPLNVVKKVDMKDEGGRAVEELKETREAMAAPVTPTTSKIRHSPSEIASIEDMPIDEVSHRGGTSESMHLSAGPTPVTHGPSTPSPSLSTSTPVTAIFTTPSSTSHTTRTEHTTPSTTQSRQPAHPYEPAEKSGPDSIRQVHYTPQGHFRGSREEFRVSFAFDGSQPTRSVVLQERPLINSVVAAAKERRLSGQEAWPAMQEHVPERISRVLVKKQRRSLRVSPSVAWRRLLGGRSEEIGLRGSGNGPKQLSD